MLRTVVTVCLYIAMMTITVSGQCGGATNTSQCTDDPNYAAICQAAFCDGTGMTNTAACNDPAYFTLIPHCPASCDMCAEFGFGCENTIPEDQCAALAANCADPNMFTLMEAWCPKTCGFCARPGGGGQNDTNCFDRAVNCSVLQEYCNNPATYDQMTIECPRTCNRCSASNGTCVDCNPNCAIWMSNGFCQNNAYTDQQKRENCAKSCGLCAGQKIFCTGRERKNNRIFLDGRKSFT